MQNLPVSPVTGPVTVAEKTYVLELLRSTQTALHEAVANLSDAQAVYTPVAGRWSVLDCLEHIVLVEAGIFGRIQTGMDAATDPDRRAEIRVSDVDVIKAVRSRTFQIAAPTPFVPTDRFADIAGALAAFDAGRNKAIAWVETVTGDLRTHYFVHMVLGTLDAYQALLVIASHGERHRKQIEEVKMNYE